MLAIHNEFALPELNQEILGSYKMKMNRSQSIATLSTALYTLSLFLFLTPSTQCDLDLCTTIQQMQRLHQTSLSDKEDFQSALSGAIQSLRAMAGISAVIVKRTEESASRLNSILIVVVKSPHLLSTPTDPIVSKLGIQNISLKETHPYTSLDFPPETPPPKNSDEVFGPQKMLYINTIC